MARPCELYFLRSYTFILSCAREGGRERLEGRSELSEVSEASELSDGERLVGTSSLCRDARECLAGGVRCRTARRVALCRDARSVRPLCQRLQRHGFNGDGRTDRASLQSLLV